VEIDLDQVKLLLGLVEERDISELTIEKDEERITIRKELSGPPPPPGHGTHVQPAHLPPPAPGKEANVFNAAAPQAAHTSDGPENGDLKAITAPMVGTFYRASSPSAPSFVEVGDKVTVGQTVCIIEAMKLMNDLPSEISGKIVKVCAENGATVEYGQQLFLVDAKGM
jgi:acetyl-CoA carboxylase biotin carboxyl carrier protein